MYISVNNTQFSRSQKIYNPPKMYNKKCITRCP
jgi:hypothetical protein